MDMNNSLSKENNPRRKSNPMDKICSKLEISVKDQNTETQLSKDVKLRIQKYIENDSVRELNTFLEKKVLNYEVEIGIKAMRWNLLHFAAKNNAYKIMQVILVRTFQESSEKYKELTNKQTFEGYTPLMISIIYCARECFLMLLEYGGSDLECIDNKNMTAYELALNYKNESAIRELMSYVNANGKKKDGLFVNEVLLSKPIDSALYSESNCYSKMFDCFVDCFLCFRQNDDDNLEFEKEPSNEIQAQQENVFLPQQSFLKNFNGSKLLSYLKNSEELIPIDMIPIGNKEIESKYSIEWKKLSTGNNQKAVLFDCFQPFDICENNLIIANNLMIFQCLSDHTWLVRKIVKQLKKAESQSVNINDLPNKYSIEVYFNDELKKVTVDEFIPFLKEREEPMFLSNTNEMWSQILQKGLAKIYGSYMKLSEVKPQTFIENLTGFYTRSFTLEEGNNFFKDENGSFIKDKQIMSALQDFNSKGYMILLEGREGTTLCPKNTPSAFKNYCYTILNFYEKGSKRLILVNCPYSLTSWKEKEKTEIMQLKLIKSHYNSHNQMCVWIEESQFAHFFKNVIVSFAEPNFTRTQMKIRYLLESEVEKKQENKIKSLLDNIATSAKNIFAHKNEKRDSGKSESGNINNIERIPSIKVIEPIEQFKKVSKLVFIKFKVENNKGSEYLSLAVKDNTNHTFCKIKKFNGWIDSGSKDISLEESNIFTPDLIKIQHKKGEYLCMLEVEFLSEIGGNEGVTIKSSQTTESSRSMKSLEASLVGKKEKRASIEIQKVIKKHELLVVCWSEDPIQLEHIEEEFAMIDCLESWRKNSIKNWSFAEKETYKAEKSELSFKYISERVGKKMTFMTKGSKKMEIETKFTGEIETKSLINDFIQEGYLLKIDEQNTEEIDSIEYTLNIGMISDADNQEFQYIVIAGHEDLLQSIDKQHFELSFAN